MSRTWILVFVLPQTDAGSKDPAYSIAPRARTSNLELRTSDLGPGTLPGIRHRCLPHQVLIKPADDVLEAFDAVPGHARARQLVVLAGEPDHHGGTLQVFQRAEEIFATGSRRRAVVLVAEDEHQRRLDLIGVSYRRALRELRRILERRLVEPRRRKQCEVRGVPEIRPVRNIPLTHRGLEPRRLRHNPVREEPAAAAARDAYPRFIDVALLHHFVHTRHQILVVVARVVELNDVPELLAIVGTAARIR